MLHDSALFDLIQQHITRPQKRRPGISTAIVSPTHSSKMITYTLQSCKDSKYTFAKQGGLDRTAQVQYQVRNLQDITGKTERIK
jgi:hypothetical protein